MKMNLKTNINNINYLRYMEEQEQKKCGSNDDNGGNKNTTWRERRPRKADNTQ